MAGLKESKERLVILYLFEIFDKLHMYFQKTGYERLGIH
jgi:hypothetical protein